MIVVSKEDQEQETSWQSNFVAMLPGIEWRLHLAFRHLDSEAREEAVAEASLHCLLSYTRLHDRGAAKSATASTLAWYAAKHVKRGRPAGNRMNANEPLSRYAQLAKGFRMEQLPGNWIDQIVADGRASVADQVAAKLDISAWLSTLSRRMKRIARDLAYGLSTSEVAEKQGLSPGRISQLRRTLEQSWAAFQHEGEPAPVQ